MIKLSRKISAILLILYYFAHIYAIHVHISAEDVNELNPPTAYSSETSKLNFLQQLKLYHKHLSPKSHQKLKIKKSVKSGTECANIKRDQSAFVVLNVKSHAHLFTSVDLSLINKAPPAINL